MKHRILKYKLPICDTHDLGLPAGAKVLSVGYQDSGFGDFGLRIWAKVPVVDSFASVASCPEVHRFKCVLTGDTRDDLHNCKFIGTVHVPGNNFVVHVFEKE